MSAKLIGSARPTIRANGVKATVDHVGNCVVCKHGIFTDQEWGRAPKPLLLGKAHIQPCGGV